MLDAVEQLGTVDAEVIDLRWLDRASIDWDTIGESIRKTNNVLIAEQGALGTSYGGWLADEIQRRFFDWLDQPMQRVTGGEASPEHQQGPRAGGHRADRGGRRRPRSGSWRCRVPELLRMPEVAAGATSAVLSSWTVPEDEPYAKGTVIAVIETDKAIVDFEAESDGRILRRLAAEGAEVAIGDPIALVAASGETVDDVDAALAILGAHGTGADTRTHTRRRRDAVVVEATPGAVAAP